MKKILKLKKIKTSQKAKKYINKKRMSDKVLLWKLAFFQINAPINTNEYLINVHSSPFYNYEEDSKPCSFISNDIIYDKDLFINNEKDYTNEKTIECD